MSDTPADSEQWPDALEPIHEQGYEEFAEAAYAQPAFVDAAPSGLKTPPHSIEAEESVLGGLMLDNQVWFELVEIVSANDFYVSRHRVIYETMMQLANEDEPIDAVTVAEKLRSLGSLEKAGGVGFIAELVERSTSGGHVMAYARIVRDRATLRRLVGAGNRITESAFAPQGRSVDELVDAAEQEVYRIAEVNETDEGPQPIAGLLTRAAAKLEELFQNKGALTGVSSGFTDLDKKTAGLQPSDLIIVAARPSMGKTAFAVNILEHAVMEGSKVFMFSMEMPADLIAMRILSSLGRIDQTRMRTGDLTQDDWNRFSGAVSMLKEKDLFIDDSPALTPAEVRSRCRRVKREAGGLDLVVVDYLQLMRGGGGKNENRVEEISEISRSLKGLAKELRCPVIALSQLNRALEQRPDKRPLMSDLRESGAIEQDADVILFIYLDEVYNEHTEDKGVAEIIIGKQRNGPIGRVRLSFQGNLTKFDNLAPSMYDDSYE